MGKNSQALTREERHAKVGEVRDKILAREEDFARALGGIIPPDTFVQVALTAVTENEDLQECTTESILLACLKAAQAGLPVDGRHAAMVKYRNIATFMPMVQGVTSQIDRSPKVAKVEARVVREGDEFEFWHELERDHFLHKPLMGGFKSREVDYAYCKVYWKDGTPPSVEVVDRETIEAARAISRAPDSPAWTNWYEEMSRKVAVHRASKYVDLDVQTARRLAVSMDAEFKSFAPILGRSAADDVKSRISDQLDDTKRRLQEVQARRKAQAPDEEDQPPEEEPPQREPTEEEKERAQEGKLANLRKLVEFHGNWEDDDRPDLDSMDEGELRTLLDEVRGVALEEEGNGELPLGLEAVVKDPHEMVGVHLEKAGAGKAVGCGVDVSSYIVLPDEEIPEDPTRFCARCLRWVDSNASADDTPAPVLAALLALADLETEESEGDAP